ncbi:MULTISPECIES: lasso peptide biosynthesis PqqD family chaperone [unclassified Frankia]|uniref:lasso peptide biosynthesis PqqD family chaperone n=1 Tax=unclassified Frankia TaxID=2632575 RepID=UPI002AD50C83|nr:MULTISPECIES: lasso peptide biosynthesis PqqD family chaperone [unclassified Frankia]
MLVLRKGVVHAETDYGIGLLDERSGRYWTLNPIGALVLRLLLDGGSTAQAADAVVNSYEVDVTTANRDIQTLLAQLDTAGLIATDSAR